MGKILREARDTDVWRFITPRELARDFARYVPILGDGARSGSTP